MHLSSTTDFGEIAQLVERRTHKPKVKGSIPFLATISFKTRISAFVYVFC